MQPKIFDTHTHFNFNAFKNDWEKVIERTLAKDIWFVNVGAEAKTSKRAVDIALKYPVGVYAAVGLHPIHTYDDIFEDTVRGEKVKFATKAEKFDKKFYASLIKSSRKVVAIGETGLDYFHIKKFPARLNKKLKAKQTEVFIDQLKLADELNKPIIIHCRPDKDYDAYREILEILKGSNSRRSSPRALIRGGGDNKIIGIVHCFQASAQILEEFLEYGFMVGYNGVITFTSEYDSLVKATPLERLVLETDSPWLAPAPYRGKRNESTYVGYIARKIAELKKITNEEVARVTTENAMRVFNII